MSNIGRRGGDLTVLEICIIAVGLSLDVFAYSLYKGAMLSKLKKATMVKLILIFTIWQMGSILLGNLFTLIPAFGEIATRTEEIWKFVSAFIFFIIGIVMILRSAKKEKIEEKREDGFQIKEVLIWACITSIDAFLAGIGFGFLQVELWTAIIILGVITAICTILGALAGYWLGCQSKNKIVIVGGCILLLGGVELLVRTIIF